MIWEQNTEAPLILLRLTDDEYSLAQVYQEARKKRDPYLSPHGHFRLLNHGNHAAALGFMQQFGPLTWTLVGLDVGRWIDLSDFWAKHARFVGIAQLWEARDDPTRLREAWEWIRKNLQKMNGAGLAPLGAFPGLDEAATQEGATLFPWQLSPGEERRPFNKKRITHVLQTGELLPTFAQVGSSLDRISRELALTLVHYELLLHTQDCRVWWTRVGDGPDAAFRQTRRLTSLWGALWELFGLETLGGMGWRVCELPECRRFFYPIRTDSTCCRPEHQALWSKRCWAREHRK